MFYAYDTDKNCLGGTESKETLIKIMADNKISYATITDVAPSPKEATVDELKALKLAELKAARDNLEVAAVTYKNNTYDFDDKSRDRLEIALKALEVQGEKATIEWTMADNTTATISANDITMVYVTAAARSNDLHGKYRDLKAKVAAATTADEINAINFN